MIELQVSGLDDVSKRLKQLATELERKELRRAARKGAIVLRDGARANFQRQHIDDPKSARNIGRNIAIQESRRLGQRIGGIAMRVGVQGGARKAAKGGGPGGDTWYWRLHEFGTVKMRARPFLRPALAEKAQAAADAVAEALNASLNKLVP